MRIRLVLMLCVFAGLVARTQGDRAVIAAIEVAGNKQTRERVILRELPFAVGDSIALDQLPERLRTGEQQLMNTSLFNAAEITYADWEGSTNRVTLLVTVRENWYIYPVPVFELADRSFNVWWSEQNRSLDRINYGLKFAHQNFTGSNDQLDFGAEFGYTRRFSFGYDLPYLNRAGTLGAGFNINFRQNREVNYLTHNNKQLFYQDPDEFIYQRFNADFGMSFRPALYTTHRWILSFQRSAVDDVVLEHNANFFGQQQGRQRYFSLSYSLVTDRRDVRAYPWKGTYVAMEVEKNGLGIFNDRNALTLAANYRHYYPFGSEDQWSFGLVTSGKVSLIRTQQPYTDSRALGFGINSLQGYEFYIVDGMDLLLIKTSLRYHLLSKNFYFGKLVPISAFRNMPVKAFLGINGDTGFANDPYTGRSNPLSNRLLYGGGISFDLLFYNDKLVSLQYNFNHLMERAFFLKLDLNI